MISLRSQLVGRALAGMVLLASTVAPVLAATTMSHAHSGPTRTLTGEVVDTGCFLAHGARGAKHVSCANKCIAGGMPMGLLTADGTLYLLTLDHDNADPYNQLKGMAGKTVAVTGAVVTRGGMKGIDVTGAKLVAAR